MNLIEKVKNLPSSPGVYLMKDSLGTVIYVGKSKELKKRVQSYFQNSKSHTTKVQNLVKNIRNFDFILTDTEFEALLLECKLIKELKPRYNRKMNNVLSYVYIGIQTDEMYDGIKMIDTPYKEDCNLYFGPYTSRSTVEKAVEGIKQHYKISCNTSYKNSRECFNHSLGLCIGMCLENDAAKHYYNIMNKIIGLLRGTDPSILEDMKQSMIDASEKFDFEVAAKYRDSISAINYLINAEKIIRFTEENKNIVSMEYLNDHMIKLFLIKGNMVLFSEKYNLKPNNTEQVCATIKANIVTYLTSKVFNSPIEVDKDQMDEAHIIYSYLKNNTANYIIVPEKWLNSKGHGNIDVALNELTSKFPQ